MTIEYYEIPCNPDGAPSFSETVNINGSYYVLKFDWNTRDDVWLLSIFDTDNNVIIGNMKLVVDYELMSMHKVLGMPNVRLFLFDFSGQSEACGFDDLGNRCKLVYQVVV